jgi:hypothetical protein
MMKQFLRQLRFLLLGHGIREAREPYSWWNRKLLEYAGKSKEFRFRTQKSGDRSRRAD